MYGNNAGKEKYEEQKLYLLLDIGKKIGSTASELVIHSIWLNNTLILSQNGSNG